MSPAQDSIDIFCLAHALGWFGKAMVLRDYWFCWVCDLCIDSAFRPGWLISSSKILSIAFEFAEYSLQHQLPNFNEVRLSGSPNLRKALNA